MESTTKNSLLIPILAIVLSAIITGGVVYAIQNNSNQDTKNNLNGQILSLQKDLNSIKKTVATPTPVASLDPTADWKTIKSTLVNFSFKAPTQANYSENEYLAERVPKGLKMTGHQVNYRDDNKVFPDFDVTSSNFTVEDSAFHDLVSGTLESKSSFTVVSLQEGSTITTEVAPGMYKVTGYGNIECSLFVTSYLFVKSPQNSGLKYISFILGNDQEAFAQSELQEVCNPKADAITRRVNNLDSSTSIATTLDKAMRIAKTFAVK